MKKHRLLSLILAGCILLTGCSGGDDGDAEATTTQPYVEVTDSDGNTVTDDEGNIVTSIISLIPEEKELNVGFIYPGTAGGDTVSQIFESARVEAERTLKANTCYVENVLVGQFEDATAQLVSNGCNVIIAASSRYANAAYEEARANSKIYFITVGGGTKTSYNLACFQGEMYKAAYVCGMAAAYNSDNNILGIVADPAILSCFNIVDAYVLGAEELTERDTDVRMNYAWGSSDSENREAIDDLIAQGCDVIFTATYSTYAVEYCEQRGVKVIGMAYNTPELAPENYLTGCFYNVSLFIIDMLRSVRYNTSESVTYLGGINEGAVRLVDFNENCKQGTEEVCGALYQLCADGRAVIFNGEIRDNNGNVKVEKGAVLKSGEILSIDWLEESIKEVKDFCTPVVEPLESDLVIHR